jgi:gas vesicle protein
MPGSGKKNSSPIMSAVKGAIVGGIAVAGAMTLADEQKREQLKKSFIDAKDKVVDFAEEKKEAVMTSASNIKGTLDQAAEDIKDTV